jgi:acetyl esterase/lipase
MKGNVMNENSNKKPFQLNGRWQYRLRSVLVLYWSFLAVSVRRLFRGPRLPGWSWTFEVAIHFLRKQTITAFDMRNPDDGREYEDSLVFHSPAVEQVTIEAVAAPVKGHWFCPKNGNRNVTVLYLHGGGYAYYAAAHRNLISLVTLAAQSKTFALDYRLIPEHPFPAQLEDAMAAYRWLLESGVSPHRLIIAGDSAGGHLVLSLLLSLRDARLPLPALAICIAPWTDVQNSGESMTKNESYDWVEKRMAVQWAEWLCQGADSKNPLISPIQADLGGLPPIYIQAGSAEILHDMIREFENRAKAQNADVTLEVWQNMNHDFQGFGAMVPESKQALQRIGEVVEKHLPI